MSVCECVCVRGAGGLGGTLLVIIGGGGPELELGKDWRRFPPPPLSRWKFIDLLILMADHGSWLLF